MTRKPVKQQTIIADYELISQLLSKVEYVRIEIEKMVIKIKSKES